MNITPRPGRDRPGHTVDLRRGVATDGAAPKTAPGRADAYTAIFEVG